jgi:hypothetical protein
VEVVVLRVRRDDERDLVAAVATTAAAAVDGSKAVRLRCRADALACERIRGWVSVCEPRLSERASLDVARVVVTIVVELDPVVVVSDRRFIGRDAASDPSGDRFDDPFEPAHRIADRANRSAVAAVQLR